MKSFSVSPTSHGWTLRIISHYRQKQLIEESKIQRAVMEQKIASNLYMFCRRHKVWLVHSKCAVNGKRWIRVQPLRQKYSPTIQHIHRKRSVERLVHFFSKIISAKNVKIVRSLHFQKYIFKTSTNKVQALEK